MPGSSSLVPILRDTVPGRECDILQGPNICFATIMAYAFIETKAGW